ncbi:hypothetical protein IDJ77_02445 [Mucilaginibacter sp. ZT4R22]|uniref:Uncharacterized protein n=1 Tax=Mucilaginibacter pankratovii TaxID=2772110 RepID=A0ABR7WKM2_9SPHI|nr:hypothetical protein [Mucilaginibacter pankratovii]MBD1362658.1 hypothetical protein [Mucilaginibacter pankratovii]
MIKKIKISYLAAILPVLLFSACEKEGTHIMPTIKAINKNFEISGFVLGDTIEQYFDGLKMREYYGRVSQSYAQNQMAFVTDEVNMELRKKSTGETVYQQKFSINDKDNVVPKFYFNGSQFSNQYTYPAVQGNDYTTNFFVDSKGASAPVDINLEVLEYRYDDTKPDPLIVVNTTVFPLAKNIQPGEWTAYVKIPAPVVIPQQSGTDLYPIVVVRDSKTQEYYIDKDRDRSVINMELPYVGVSPGKVQSVYLNRKPADGTNFYLEQYELVQLFPR